jgi:hypothetical protein
MWTTLRLGLLIGGSRLEVRRKERVVDVLKNWA